MNRNAMTIMCVFIVLLGMFFISNKVKNKDSIFQSKGNETERIKRKSPESLIDQFYSMETTKDEEYLKQFFYLSKNDTSGIKLKLRSFNVKKISIDKIIKMEENVNKAVVSCSYNTYFKGINNPRTDIEVIKLVKEKQGWYILNDINDIKDISDLDKKWLVSTELKQKMDLSNNEATRKIFDSQASFDEKNKIFMEEGSKKYRINLMKEKK